MEITPLPDFSSQRLLLSATNIITLYSFVSFSRSSVVTRNIIGARVAVAAAVAAAVAVAVELRIHYLEDLVFAAT